MIDVDLMNDEFRKSPAAARVFAYLLWYSIKKRNAEFYTSRKKIMQSTGILSKKTITESLKALVRIGIIEKDVEGKDYGDVYVKKILIVMRKGAWDSAIDPRRARDGVMERQRNHRERVTGGKFATGKGYSSSNQDQKSSEGKGNPLPHDEDSMLGKGYSSGAISPERDKTDGLTTPRPSSATLPPVVATPAEQPETTTPKLRTPKPGEIQTFYNIAHGFCGVTMDQAVQALNAKDLPELYREYWRTVMCHKYSQSPDSLPPGLGGEILKQH